MPATPDEIRAGGEGKSEDYARFSDAELQDWTSRWPYNPATGKFTNKYGDQVDKPDERGPNTPPGYNGTGDYFAGGFGRGGGGRGRGRGRGRGGGGRGRGGTPQFDYQDFVAPTYEQAMEDPGYQFALGEGQDAIERSAAARGALRTGGTLRDLVDYSQGAAAQQYQNVYDRAAQTHGMNYQTAKDKFAPQYGAWQTRYGGDLSKWTTRYGGDLSKYLQKQGQVYGALNQPPPQYGY